MKKIFKNSAGFGVIELLLIVVIVGLIGFVGYYVYSQRSNSDSNSQDVSTQPAEKEAADYLVIEQWGIKVPQLSNGGSISYQISEHDENQADFVTSEQKALGGNCGDFSFARYRIYQAEKGYKFDDEILQSALDEAAANSLVIEANNKNYYILGDMSGGDCTGTLEEGQSVSQQEVAANDNLLSALKGLIAN